MPDDWRPWRISSPELLSRYVNHVAAAQAVADDFFAGLTVDGAETSLHDLRSSGRLDKIVEAIYRKLSALGIKYDVEPVSLASPLTFEQEIRTPGEVVNTKTGTCLDLALVFASLCIHIRLLPVIVLLRNNANQSAHAVVVVDGEYTFDDWDKPRGWKEADRKNAIIGRRNVWAPDGELWQRVVEGRYIPVECTGLSATRFDGRGSDTLSFAEAGERARQCLQNYEHTATLDVVRFQKDKGYTAYQPPVVHWPKFSKLGLWRQTQKAHLTRLQHPFVGRYSARKTVQDFLEKQDGPRQLCMTAPAGYGKSALMAQLVLSHPGSVYRFVGEGESGADLLGSICTQLSALNGEHAKYSGRPAIELKEIFEQLVAAVVRTRDQDGALPIFIDGLDEGLLEGPNRVTRLELLSDPPAGTRLVLSYRTGLEDQLASGDRLLLKLDEFRDSDVRDLFMLFGRADLAGDPDLIRQLMIRTDGEPFYLRFLTEDLAQAASPASIFDRLPKRAEEYLQEQLRRILELLDINGISIALAVLVQAKGWLRRTSLLNMLGNAVGTDETLRILRALRPRFLAVQRPSDPLKQSDEAYRLWPIRLRDAVHETLAGSPDLARGKDILIDFCRNWPAHRDPYALEHACGHFFEQDNLGALTGMLTGEFLRARAEREGGFHSPLVDTEKAVRLALERRDVAKIVRTAGTHAWLQTIVGWRATHGGIALDAQRGHIRSALSGARAIRDPLLRRCQLLVIADALLKRGRHEEAAEIAEEAVKIPGMIDDLDHEAVNTLARDLLRETGRVELAGELWTSHGSYDSADKMMAEVTRELVGRKIDRALEIAAKISSRETRREAFATIRQEANSRNMPIPEGAIDRDDAAERPEPKENAIFAELAKTDPMKVKSLIEQGMEQCTKRLKEDQNDHDAVGILNQLIIQLANVDPMRAVDLAINEARGYSTFFHRGTVLAEVGLIVAERNGPVEAMRRLLQSTRAHAEKEGDRSRPSAVDRLSLALLPQLSDLDEIYTILAQMDGSTLRAEAALARLALGSDEMARAANVVERASRVTDQMVARLKQVQTSRAEQFLAMLPAGPVRWWLKLAMVNDDPAAVAELRDAALKTLPPAAQLAALMELARRFSDVASLRHAAELQNAPGTWEGRYEFKRTDNVVELARLATQLDPDLALELYRDAARGIPDEWHERARHGYALDVFDTLAETGFEADKQTLQSLFELLQTDYSRSRTIMRVKGADAVIANIADRVEARVSPIVTSLLTKARDAEDASLLARLGSIYPEHAILSIKTIRARITPPGSSERHSVVSDIIELFSQSIPEQEYPGQLIYEVGHILAHDRPDALADAAANLNLFDRSYLWIGAAAAKLPTSAGVWDRLIHALRPSPAMQWLRCAEDAATAIETAENGHSRRDSTDSEPSPPDDEPDDWKLNDRKAYAAMNCAAAYANMALFAGEILTRRRRIWVERAFRALGRIKVPYHRLPLTMRIALMLADLEPDLCRRAARRAAKMLPELLRERAVIDQLKETLEKARNSIAQMEIRRQAWESILDLASLVADSDFPWSKHPLIEEEPELFALAAYWIEKLGGHVPETFWKQAETAVEAKFASVGIEMKDYREKISNQVLTLSMAAHALSHRSPMARELDRLADSQDVLVTAFRYYPRLPEDADCWKLLVGRIQGLGALEAAARRAGNHRSSAALFPLLKQYPPSPHRSKILQILLNRIDDSALLVPLVDVAIDYPRDLTSWATAFVRLCGDHARDWHAILDEIMELRKLSTSASLSASIAHPRAISH